jgi:hypothetical protein
MTDPFLLIVRLAALEVCLSLDEAAAPSLETVALGLLARGVSSPAGPNKKQANYIKLSFVHNSI